MDEFISNEHEAVTNFLHVNYEFIKLLYADKFQEAKEFHITKVAPREAELMEFSTYKLAEKRGMADMLDPDICKKWNVKVEV